MNGIRERLACPLGSLFSPRPGRLVGTGKVEYSGAIDVGWNVSKFDVEPDFSGEASELVFRTSLCKSDVSF